MSILRIQEVKATTGHKSHVSVYDAIKDGLFTEPVKIGARSSGWPDYEVEAINAARIAGKTEDEIRVLVRRLHAKRAERFAAVEQAISLVDAHQST
ncbi:AlpA family phage regulatory protein [Ottowia sp.]|mgnify:CR=1 FL=1|uniref:helix-turn-helix transcriptional regulator n=1 Tax=Ottowia sp. TaxID=1898956 RepID=UPI002C2D718A|nr:AlpA family phage regulatory protein [Ottowia sp.]HRN76597.1 AlpA family phage regulatory protein [Ottowia sp.]HRQ03640.1 AlpA family phage regulatory protein [Ottowia sp.]